jgi:hypothetical protein
MEIKTTDEIVLTEKIKFKVDIHGNIIEVKSKINKQWVAVDDLKKELQKNNSICLFRKLVCIKIR